MDDLIASIRQALVQRNYYSALFLTIMIPSVCGALESADGEDNRVRYVGWFDRYVNGLFLRGEDCYSLRCALVHQARTSHQNLQFDRVLFTLPTPRQVVLHNNIVNRALNLDLGRFCEQVIQAVPQWARDVEGNANYLRNTQRLIRTYPNGLAPFIVGIPLIS